MNPSQIAGIVIISIVLAFLIYTLILFFISLNQLNTVEMINEEYEKYDTKKLLTLIELSEKKNAGGINKELIQTYYDDYSMVKTYEVDLKKTIAEAEEYSNKKFKFKPKEFDKIYNELEDKLFDFKISYLKLRISVNDSLIPFYARVAIVEQVKAMASSIQSSYNNAEFPIVKNHMMDLQIENMINKVKEFDVKLKTDDFEDVPGSNENIQLRAVSDLTTSILQKIEFVRSKVIGSLEVVNYLEKEIEESNQTIAKIYQKYKQPLAQMVTELNSYDRYTDEVKDRIYTMIDDMNIDKAISIKEDHERKKIQIETNLFFNAKSYELVEKYKNNLRQMFVEYFSQKENIVYEIGRHKVLGKDKKIYSINNSFSKAQREFHVYESMSRDNFRDNKPSEILGQLEKTVIEFKNFINVVKENVKDVNQIIQSTDAVNKDISLANVLLLQAEQYQMDLPHNIKPKFKKKTLELHTKLDETIVKYRLNVGEITEEQKQNVKSIVEEIREFNLEMNAQAFLYAYAKWLIVYLNKYRNSSDDFGIMSQQMENSYSSGDIQECLRIGRVLVETQGLYE